MNKLKFKSLALVVTSFFSNAVFAGLVNINEADSAALAYHLKGVGEKKAESIIEYRKLNGAFTEVEDLTEVKGIGKAILKKNLNDISLGDGAVTVLKDGMEAGVKVNTKAVVIPEKVSKKNKASTSLEEVKDDEKKLATKVKVTKVDKKLVVSRADLGEEKPKTEVSATAQKKDVATR